MEAKYKLWMVEAMEMLEWRSWICDELRLSPLMCSLPSHCLVWASRKGLPRATQLAFRQPAATTYRNYILWSSLPVNHVPREPQSMVACKCYLEKRCVAHDRWELPPLAIPSQEIHSYINRLMFVLFVLISSKKKFLRNQFTGQLLHFQNTKAVIS